MGSPDWSKIPFEKMPEWKRQEILGRNKKVIEELTSLENKAKEEFVCEICNKVCKNKLGLTSHKRSHNKIK